MEHSIPTNASLLGTDAVGAKDGDNKMKTALRMATTAIFQNICQILNTPVKNKKMATDFLGAEQFQKITSKYSARKSGVKGLSGPQLFSVWHKASMLRDLARNVFHGSVLADIAETSGSMINFASFAKAICAEIGEASLTDDLWKSFKDKAAKQGHIDFRKLMVKLYDKDVLTQEDVEPLLHEENGFDTSFDNLKVDFEKFKQMGVKKSLFNGANTYKEISLNVVAISNGMERTCLGLLKQKLYPKINPANGEEDGKWNPEPLAFMLTYFSGRSQITLDVFGRAVADFFQIKLCNQSNTEETFKTIFAKNGNLAKQYSINLENDNDVEFIFGLFELLKSRIDDIVKADPKALTQKPVAGEDVALSFKGYDVHSIRKLIDTTLKTKTGTKGPTISIEAIPSGDPTDEEADYSKLEALIGNEYKGKDDQAYWTVGDSPEYDIILAKTNVSFGSTFTIIAEGGQYYIKDNSILTQAFQPMIKLPAKKQVAVQAPYCLSLAGALLYEVAVLSGGNIKLDLIAHTLPDDASDAKSYEKPLNNGACQLGKTNKAANDIDIANKYLSRKHCVFTEGFIEDFSTFGSLLSLRKPTQERRGLQSDAVLFDTADQRVYLYGYVLAIK